MWMYKYIREGKRIICITLNDSAPSKPNALIASRGILSLTWGTLKLNLRNRQRNKPSPSSERAILWQGRFQPLTKLLMFCKECANCKCQSAVRSRKTLLLLRASDGTNLVKLVKCPKGGGRRSTENQFQAWVSPALFGNSPIWEALHWALGIDC